jgi:hypothetical protein
MQSLVHNSNDEWILIWEKNLGGNFDNFIYGMQSKLREIDSFTINAGFIYFNFSVAFMCVCVRECTGDNCGSTKLEKFGKINLL